MAEYLILKAVEHDKLPVKFKKLYPTVQSLADTGWWTQRKYDGCMGIAYIDHRREDCRMLSRTGEDYSKSCEFILNELYDGPKLRGKVLIGEVWEPIDRAAFPAISGKFRRQRADTGLRFMVHDLLPTGLVTREPYRMRFADLCEFFPPVPLEYARCHVAETYQTKQDAEARALQWQGEGGFDGAIMRDPNAGYTIGTVKAGEIVKVKPTLSLDLLCVSWEAGEGKHAGKIGALVVEYKGVRSGVGTGLSDADRDSNVLSFVGKIVEIECLGITAEGKLREPRFKGVRHDKLKAD